ncbi:MAG: hypothetical protein HFE63_09130 [Clostridiales bacterium]|nr:hypothetical protein [Clostridiales bacterium]
MSNLYIEEAEIDDISPLNKCWDELQISMYNCKLPENAADEMRDDVNISNGLTNYHFYWQID